MRAFQKSKDEDGVVTAEKYAFDGDTDSPSWIGSDTGLAFSTTPVGVGAMIAGASTVVSGDYHSCALISGAVKCWGQNTSGQLGDGTTTNSDKPVQVVGLTAGVAEVSAGVGHTCARLDTGAIKCWGRNVGGQLGDGTTTQRNTPVSVGGIDSGTTDLGAGGNHTCAVVEGAAKCWGNNGLGQLGNNSSTSSNVPVQVTGLTSGTRIIDGGAMGTCAVTEAGGAKCWGGGSSGQLGNGTSSFYQRTPVNVTGMSTGTQDIELSNGYACATTDAGAVKCWGANGVGQLGDGSLNKRLTPVNVQGIATGATKVSMGYNHTCAVVDGAVKCWGGGASGRLGNGSTQNRVTPVQVTGMTEGATTVSAGYAHVCTRTTTNKVRCWGSNSAGQIGPRPSSTYTRYVTAIGGGLAASYKSTGQIRFQIANVRGDVVAEADQNGLQQAAAVDEFGVPEDGALPEGRRYGFMGSHQREALTPGGTVAMGVRLYVPQLGRFLQVDPVLGGTENPYEYPSDPVNENDLDGKKKFKGKLVLYYGKKQTKKIIRILRNRARREQLTAEIDQAVGGAGLGAAITGFRPGIALAVVGGLGYLWRQGRADDLDAYADLLKDLLDDSGGRGVKVVIRNKTGNLKDFKVGVYSKGSGDPNCGYRRYHPNGDVDTVAKAKC